MIPTRSIFRFRWVSKQFHSIISDPSFIYSLALRAASSLIIQTKEDNLKDTIDLYLINRNNTSESTWVTMQKPIKSDLSLLACCDGLLCFRAWNYYVFNPCTKGWITVPCTNYPESGTRMSTSESPVLVLGDSPTKMVKGPLVPHRQWGRWSLLLRVVPHLSKARRILKPCDPRVKADNFVHVGMLQRDSCIAPKMYVNEPRYLCGFYFHPPTGEYRLLARVRGIGFEVYALGTNSWRGISASTDNPTSCTVDHSLAVHGNLHWVGTEGIIVFNMESEEFSLLAYPAECNAWYQNQIMIMAQYLGLCKVTPQRGLEVWILKDHARKIWIKKYTISMHEFVDYSIRLPITLSDKEILLLCRDHREHQDSLIFYNANCNALKKFDIEGLSDWRSCKTFGMPFTTNFDEGKKSLNLSMQGDLN